MMKYRLEMTEVTATGEVLLFTAEKEEDPALTFLEELRALVAQIEAELTEEDSKES